MNFHLIGLVLWLAASACVKNSGSVQYAGTGDNSVLTLSKSDLKRGEQLLASTNESNPNAIIKWSTEPSTNTLVLPANKQAAALFAYSGSYQIKANYYNASDTTIAYDSSSSVVTVNDSIYAPLPGSNLDSASLAGDQITLVPISASDSGLIVLAKTSRLYNCTPYLTAYAAGGTIYSGLLFDFNWAEVVEGTGDCMGAKNPATAYIFFEPAANGTYQFSATLNQVTYQGTVTISATDYIFTWNYNSGIIISPLQISRH